jgi:hypothetical protein
LIEQAHDYPERSFLPGRTFCSPVDFNTQLADWLAVGIEIIADLAVGAVCDGKLVADHERIWGWHQRSVTLTRTSSDLQARTP